MQIYRIFIDSYISRWLIQKMIPLICWICLQWKMSHLRLVKCNLHLEYRSWCRIFLPLKLTALIHTGMYFVFFLCMCSLYNLCRGEGGWGLVVTALIEILICCVRVAQNSSSVENGYLNSTVAKLCNIQWILHENKSQYWNCALLKATWNLLALTFGKQIIFSSIHLIVFKRTSFATRFLHINRLINSSFE